MLLLEWRRVSKIPLLGLWIRCYGSSNPLSTTMEEKESINENIPEEELESANGGRNRSDLKREIQERNREPRVFRKRRLR